MYKILKYILLLLSVTIILLLSSLLIINSINLNQFKEKIENKVTKLTGRAFKINGDVELKLSLHPKIKLEKVSFANANWAKPSEMLRFDTLKLQLELLPLLYNEIIIEKLHITNLNLDIQTNKQNQNNWFLKNLNEEDTKDIGATNESFELPSIPIFKSILLDNIHINYTDAKDKIKTLINLHELKLSHEKIGQPIHFSSEGTINGKVFIFSGATKKITNSDDMSLQFEAEAVGVKISSIGSTALSANDQSTQAQLHINIANLNNSYTAITGRSLKNYSIDISKPIKLKLSTNIDLKNESLHFQNIALNMVQNKANSDINGDITIKNLDETPNIIANLLSNKINLNLLTLNSDNKINSPKNTSPKVANKTNEQIFSSEHLIPLNIFNGANVDLHYKIKHLTKNHRSLKNIELHLLLKDNKLKIQPLKMDFINAKVISSLELKQDKILLFDTSTDIKSLDSDELMAFFGIHEYAKGDIDANIHLKGSGVSISELMASLTGKVRISSQNGTLDRKALNILSPKIDLLVPFTEKGSRQKIHCLVLDFNIENGKAKSHALIVDTGIASAIGSGEINLATETISIYIEPRYKDASLRKLLILPVNISGNLFSTSIIPDAMGVLSVIPESLSLLSVGLADKLWEKFIDDTNYCHIALSGKKVAPVLSKKDTSNEATEGSSELWEEH